MPSSMGFDCPFDPRGDNPANYIIDEMHDLEKIFHLGRRVFILDRGYFYDDTLVVRDAGGRTLIRGTDYVTMYLHKEATELTGRAVVGVVVIINRDISSLVFVDAHMVGGEYCFFGELVARLQDIVKKDQRNINWYNIADIPKGFKPVMHKHRIDTIFGWESVELVLNKVVEAIRKINAHRLQQRIDEIYGKAGPKRLALLNEQLQRHMDEKNNPHHVTPEKIHLGPYAGRVFIDRKTIFVQNYWPNNFITFGGLDTYAQYYCIEPLKKHTNPILNNGGSNVRQDPHETTLEQVGAYDAYTIDLKLRDLIKRGEDVSSADEIYGQSKEKLIYSLQQNLIASNVVGPGTLSPAMLGKGTPSRDVYLHGDGTWRDPADEIRALLPAIARPIYIGYMGKAENNEAFKAATAQYASIAEYPVGSLLIYTETFSINENVNNHLYQTTGDITAGAYRTAQGWEKIDLIDHQRYHVITDPFTDTTFF